MYFPKSSVMAKTVAEALHKVLPELPQPMAVFRIFSQGEHILSFWESVYGSGFSQADGQQWFYSAFLLDWEFSWLWKFLDWKSFLRMSKVLICRCQLLLAFPVLSVWPSLLPGNFWAPAAVLVGLSGTFRLGHRYQNVFAVPLNFFPVCCSFHVFLEVWAFPLLSFALVWFSCPS